MSRRTFTIVCRDEGRGLPERRKFCSLDSAAKYIRDRWQGPEYCDGESAFHTDYCTYELIGFTLYEIGRFWFSEDGCREFTFASDEQGPPIDLIDDHEPDEYEYGGPRLTASITFEQKVAIATAIDNDRRERARLDSDLPF